jgi:hypothetical protein
VGDESKKIAEIWHKVGINTIYSGVLGGYRPEKNKNFTTGATCA